MGDVKNPGVIRNTSSGGSVSVTPASGYGVVNLEVNLSGGGITGILPIANGGTSSDTASGAIKELILNAASFVNDPVDPNTFYPAVDGLSNDGSIIDGASLQASILSPLGALAYQSTVNLGTQVTGDLAYANLAQGSALSVLGVTGNATADNASIVAASDAQVLRRSGTSVGFGAIDLASANAVSGVLAEANGGYRVYDEPSVAALSGQTINAGSTYTWSIPLSGSDFTHGIIQVMNVDGSSFPYNSGVTAIIATATTDCYGWSANINYVYSSYISTVLFRAVSVHTNLTGNQCFGNGTNTGDVRVNSIRINGSNIDIVFGNSVALSRTINARAQYRLGKGTVQSA